MDRLTYLNTLTTLLWDHMEEYCKPITSQFIHCENAHYDMPHALICSRSNMVNRLIAKKHIFNLFKEVHSYSADCQGNVVTRELLYGSDGKTEVTYKTYPHFIEIDLEVMAQNNSDKMALPELLKQMTSQRNIHGHRHVILLHNMDALSSALMHALRKVLETYSANAYLVMTCRAQTHIIDAIRSRCVIVNPGLDIRKIAPALIDECRPELSPYVDVILNKANHDLINLVILLELPCPDAYIGHLAVFVEGRLKELCTTKDHHELEVKTRDMCTKITAACVSIPYLMKKIIEFVMIYAPPCVHTVVEMAANIEHKIAISNKAVFALEYFMHELIQLMRPHFVKTELRLSI